MYIGGVTYHTSMINFNMLNSAIMISSDPIIEGPAGCIRGFVAFDWPFYLFIVIFIITFFLVSSYIYKKNDKKGIISKKTRMFVIGLVVVLTVLYFVLAVAFPGVLNIVSTCMYGV